MRGSRCCLLTATAAPGAAFAFFVYKLAGRVHVPAGIIAVMVANSVSQVVVRAGFIAARGRHIQYYVAAH